MKAVLQRVAKASVFINNSEYSAINNGLLVFIGFNKQDTLKDIKKITKKILNLRIFPDSNYKMNLSLNDVNGELLIVSQFTLYADCTKGNRPSFINAAKPVHAKKIYAEFVNYMHNQNLIVKTGIFGEHMEVSLTNDGPVTLMIDTKK